MYRFVALRLEIPVKKIVRARKFGAIPLSYPPRVRVRAMVKLSAAFFHDESSITIGGYESAIAPEILQNCDTLFLWLENSKTKSQDPWKFHMIFS